MKLLFKKIIYLFAAGLLGCQATSAQDVVRKFDLGSGEVHKGFTGINAQTLYTPENGFGIISEHGVNAEKSEGECNLTNDWITSDQPFFFKIDLPEGRYKITVTLGNSEAATATTVKAESRRLMLENIHTEKGEVITKTFVVDLRTPRINDTLELRRKPREMTYLNWDNSLTLEFNGPKPCVSSIVIESANGLRAIFLAGDSTVTDQENEPWASWGQMFPRFLKPEIAVCNYAESGETLKAFRRANRLAKIISVMKPGDYLFIEFGHNDQKPGGNHVDPFTTYQEQIRFYMNEARKKGGIPVLVTSTARRAFDENGKIKKTLLEYPDAMRQLAKEENVALIDLNAMTKVLYETLGVENSTHAFVHYPANTFPGQDKALADNTHFNPYGAYELAKCVVQSILDQKLELAQYVVDDFGSFDPAKPDDYQNFFWPASPAADVVKPDGN